ncbi:MAG: lytic transglycosylase domain-containing protein [Thiobacillaceae bacterium]|nr:lytic transglycosylase domain-containing protein [Thiobacillaceae bacterium]MDW8324365.1 lytic transglycosylase domain-containing protein [Burkholderiales bacterium]
MPPSRYLIALLLFACGLAWAGAQRYEPLSASVRAQLSKAVADMGRREAAFADDPYVRVWLAEMSRRLEGYIPDPDFRADFLNTLHYEATRAGLDPELVLGLIEVESGFRKYAVSIAGAMGLMQVMPFWVDLIGTREHNLFHLRTNLRYGCTILRHYLDIERGDLFRALGRYNGSLGRSEYPMAVYTAWRKRWTYGITPVGLKRAPAAVRKGT